jgi:nucleoside-diphosphate-sugar epimerase
VSLAGVRFTILGARGFIGSRLVAHLAARGAVCRTPARGERVAGDDGLGHVICCAGVTADFRTRPFDAVRAHVGVPLEWLAEARFDSLLYLSSTRVYTGLLEAREDAVLRIDPGSPDAVYDTSKIMGEALCLASPRPTVRVVRLSNVYGPDWGSPNFLASIVRDAVERRRIVLQSTLESAKDYVSVDEVVAVLPRIALHGAYRVYNVASGVNTSHGALARRLAELTGCRVDVADGVPTVTFPPITIDRVRGEFAFRAGSVIDALDELVAQCGAHPAGSARA